MYSFASAIFGNIHVNTVTLGRTVSCTMTTRYQWQCRGCKALFSSQKSAKIHVSFHIRAEAAPSGRAAAARARAEDSDSDPPPPAGLGRRRGRSSATAGYRRPGLHTGPANSDGPPTRASRSAGPDPGGPRQNHWPQGLRDSARSGADPLYQMVILDPQRGSARIVSLAVIAPGGAARDHDSDSDAGGGRLGPALSSESGSDSDSGL